MSSVDTSALHALGKTTEYLFNGPHAKLLERFESPFKLEQFNLGNNAVSKILITAPEFTSLCPLTGQPDFATIVIEYQPNDWCVESKALKLYLGSFRGAGEFHEACVARMAKDLIDLLDPKYLMVRGEYTPRGGIPFWPEVKYYQPIQYEKLGSIMPEGGSAGLTA